MIIPAFYGLLSIFFAYLEDKKILKNGLKLSFVILFLFSALRYNYGNDYIGYLNYFINNQGKSISDIILFDDSVEGQIEPGWIFLNRLFAPIGFFALVGFLSTIHLFVVYRFIKNYCHPGYYWFAVFYYFFQPYLMLVLLSAMRQAIAVSIFLLSIELLMKRKIFLYMILIGISYFFHRSSIVLLLLVPLAIFNVKFRKVYVLILIAIFFIILSYTSEILVYMTVFIDDNLENYYTYTKNITSIISVGVTFLLMLIIYSIIFYFSALYSTFKETFLFKISMLAFFIFPLTLLLPMLSRLNFYFNHSLLVVLPLVFVKQKPVLYRLVFIMLIILFTIGQFYLFFKSSIWVTGYSSYQTIFSAPKFY